MSNRLLEIVRASVEDLLEKQPEIIPNVEQEHAEATPPFTLAASPLLPISSLTNTPAPAVYIIYTQSDRPVSIGMITSSTTVWDLRRVVKDSTLLGDAVSGVRIVEVDSDEAAAGLDRVLGELFGRLFLVTPGGVDVTGGGDGLPFPFKKSKKRVGARPTPTTGKSKKIMKKKKGPGRPKKTSVEVISDTTAREDQKVRSERPLEETEYVLTNPPFGTKNPGRRRTSTNTGYLSSYAASALGEEEKQTARPFDVPEVNDFGLPMTKTQRREWKRKQLAKLK